MTALAAFQIRVHLRGRAPVVAALVFGLAAGLVALVGLGSFQQVGLGAVGPAAAALVNLAILLPTAQAVLLGALAMTTDRETGFSAVLRARGAGPIAVVLAAWIAVTVSAWISLLAGFGVAALVIAGNVPVADVVTFASVFGVMLLVAAAAAAIGILIGTLASTRLQAALAGVAVWFLLAIGLDLLVIGLGVFVRLGEAAIVAAIAIDVFTSGRLAALLILDADGAALGSTGMYLVRQLGGPGAVLALLATASAWVLVALLVAIWRVARLDG